MSYSVMAMMLPVESDVSLRVEDTGGNGKPIFFVHGWPLDSRCLNINLQLSKEQLSVHWLRSSGVWYVRKAMARL